MGILQLIASRNFISVNKELIMLLGLDEAILLGELASEYDYWEKQNALEDGFFYSTIENIENNTTLSEFKQRKALNKLKNLNLIDIKIKGIPAKRYIRINEDQVIELLKDKFLKNSGTGCLKIEELDTEKLKGNNNINNNNITNKNNNKKESKKESFDELIDNYTYDEELRFELKNHLSVRKAKKGAMTNRAIELSLSKLNELTKNVPINEAEKVKIKIVQQSIENGWIGFFELKKQYGKKSNDGWDYINTEFEKTRNDLF